MDEYPCPSFAQAIYELATVELCVSSATVPLSSLIVISSQVAPFVSEIAAIKFPLLI